jgi:hypothetical protein
MEAVGGVCIRISNFDTSGGCRILATIIVLHHDSHSAANKLI